MLFSRPNIIPKVFGIGLSFKKTFKNACKILHKIASRVLVEDSIVNISQLNSLSSSFAFCDDMDGMAFVNNLVFPVYHPYKVNIKQGWVAVSVANFIIISKVMIFEIVGNTGQDHPLPPFNSQKLKAEAKLLQCIW